MNDFLPDTYKVPTKGNKYMKFQEGENRFRIMSSPILGWEWWIEEKVDDKIVRKPVRVKMEGPVPAEFADEVKHFWAMKVFNYQENIVQILEITQATIQRVLRALAKDADWGSPVGAEGYDIVVSKTGKDKETKYSITPKPAKRLDPEIVKKCNSVDVNLNALYEGKDPFDIKLTDSDIDDIMKGVKE